MLDSKKSAISVYEGAPIATLALSVAYAERSVCSAMLARAFVIFITEALFKLSRGSLKSTSVATSSISFSAALVNVRAAEPFDAIGVVLLHSIDIYFLFSLN